MLSPSQDGRGSSAGTLAPRYGRVLSFGDVLDESVRLFRQHWATFAVVSAVAFIPPGLFGIWQEAAGSAVSPLTLADIRAGRFVQTPTADPEVGAVVAISVVWVLFYCVWAAAVTATTEAYVRGGEPTLSRVYRRAVRRFFPVFLATLLYALVLTVLIVIGFLLAFLVVFPGLGGVVPGVALLVWWLNPRVRKGWLKWLIIACTPFGPLIYFGTRWSMYVAAAVLERLGPLAALGRSSQLVDRQVFRVLSILTVTSLIVGVLVYTPTLLIEIPLTIVSGVIDYGTTTEAVIAEAARVVLVILFESVGAIVYTLMFIDLRNRREGTDMAERLTQLEASPISAGG